MAHREELIRQLRRSRRRLIILSGWVSEYAFDTELKREFQRALKRGVEIRIGWGCQTNKEAACDIWKPNEAETWLRELERKFKGRLMTHRFRNHAKLLVCDDEAILGSHNWLSNVSSPNEELSLATNDPQVIEELLSKIAPRFKQSRGDRRPGIWFVSKRLRDAPEGGIKA